MLFGKKKEVTQDVNKEKFDKALKIAMIYMREGKLEEALAHSQDAVNLQPKNYYARSLNERLRHQVEQKKQQDQSDLLFRAAEDSQKLDKISRLLKTADAFIAAGRYNDALGEIKKVYEIDSMNYLAFGYSDRIEKLMEEEQARLEQLKAAQQAGTAEPVEAGPVEEVVEVTEVPAPDVQPLEQPQMSQTLFEGTRILYKEMLKEMWVDGKLSAEEKTTLAKARETFGISLEEHNEMEQQVHIDAYIEALRIAMRQGELSENGRQVLDTMRQKFNISLDAQIAAEAEIVWMQKDIPTQQTLLLVDDEVTFLQMLSLRLKKRGYDIETASSVEEAIEKLGNFTPALILADLRFASTAMSGIDFFHFVRASQRLQNIPFLMMSGIGDDFIERAGRRLGVTDFFTKPVDFEKLVATIQGKIKPE